MVEDILGRRQGERDALLADARNIDSSSLPQLVHAMPSQMQAQPRIFSELRLAGTGSAGDSSPV